MKGRAKTHIVLLDQAVVSGTNFFTGLLLARLLGIESYGHFVLAYGTILFISGIQIALIISPMMVIAPRLDNQNVHIYYKSVSIQQTVFTLTTLVTTFFIVKFLAEIMQMKELSQLSIPVAFAAAAFVSQDFLRRLLIVSDLTGHALTNDIISYGLQAIGLIYWFLYIDTKLNANIAFWIIFATSAIAILHGIAISSLATKHASSVNQQIKQNLIQHWDIGKWLLARNIAYWGSSQFLIYFAGAILSASAVGALTATRNIMGIANILFTAFENFAPSRASRALTTQGIHGLIRYLKRITVLGGSLTLLIVIIASSAPELWLNLIYGNEYSGYGWLVIAWGLHYLIVFTHRPSSVGLRAIDHTKDIFIATAYSVLAAIVVGIPMVHQFALPGVIASMIILQIIISVTLFKKLRTRLSQALLAH